MPLGKIYLWVFELPYDAAQRELHAREREGHEVVSVSCTPWQFSRVAGGNFVVTMREPPR